METTGGPESAPLGSAIAGDADAGSDLRGFDFAQAALLLRQLGAGALPDLRVERSAVFPTCEAEYDPESAALRVTFLALAGLTGPLPSPYADLAEAEKRADNGGVDDFLAMFERRLLHLFLASHLRSRFWLGHAWQHEPGALAPHGTAFEEALFALVGLGAARLRARAGLPPESLLYFAGVLSQAPASAAMLESILSSYFGADVSVEPFDGAWVDVPTEPSGRLGAPEASLTEQFALGDRFYDPAAGFRIQLGLLRLAELQALLPGTSGARMLHDFVRFAVGQESAFSYSLVLRAEETPPVRLLGTGESGARLGWTAWLDSGRNAADRISGAFHSCDLGASAVAGEKA